MSSITQNTRGTSGRSWQAQVMFLAVAWTALFGLVVGVGQLITGPLEGQVDPPDNDLARWLADERTPSITSAAGWASALGDTVTVLVVGPLIALGIGVWRRDLRDVAFVVTTMVGASGIYLLTTTLIDRPRPPVAILDPGLDPTHSFPSGHVGAATALYGLIVVLTWTYTRTRRWVATPLLLVPLLVLVARLYEGAHHLSDVLTSLVYASLWLTATAVTLLGRPRQKLPSVLAPLR